MAVLIECPTCRKKRSIRKKMCKCGEDLDKTEEKQPKTESREEGENP